MEDKMAHVGLEVTWIGLPGVKLYFYLPHSRSLLLLNAFDQSNKTAGCCMILQFHS